VISPKELKGAQPEYFTWGPISLEDDFMADYHIAEWANTELARPHEKPLFLAIGLTKPHDPWEVPKKYFDMYPLASVPDLPIKEDDLEDAFVHGRRPLHKLIVDNDQEKKVVQAYMATISFTDAMLGKVLDGLEKTGMLKNSILVVWSDHGMHMGEKENWEKFTLWERSTRAPMFIMALDISRPGTTTNVPVSLIDIYPTLAELAGEKIPEYCDGESLVPMLKGTNFTHKPVLSSFEFKLAPAPVGQVAYAVRSNRYRYIYYPFINFEELYDHETDKNEWNNVAYKSANKKIIEEHRKQLSATVPKLTWPGGGPKGYQLSGDGIVKKEGFVRLKDVLATTQWY
jgi:arylsulfatase A-like enzyme